MQWTVAAMLLIVMMGSIGGAGQSLSYVKVCTLLYGNVDDLGFSYSTNVGRLQTIANLRRRFPLVEIDTQAFPNGFFDYPTAADKRRLEADIVSSGCTIVITTGCFFCLDGTFTPHAQWNERARRFPNITWMVMWEDVAALRSRNHSNLVFFAMDQTPAYFLAGVAAATQARTCIGLNLPFEGARNGAEAGSGFLLGVQYANASMPVHVVVMDDWYIPDKEIEAARIFTDVYGCEVVARYSDPRDVDVWIQSQRSRGLMSIGSHSDLQQFVGDTVLTSLLIDWKEVFTPLVEDVIQHGAVQDSRKPIIFGMRSGAAPITTISPTARDEVQPAVDAARLAKFSSSDDVLCGPDLVTAWGSNCRDPVELIPGPVITLSTVYHGKFYRRNQCPNGSAATYDYEPLLRLRCTECPTDTYAVSGDSLCFPCPTGYSSPVNSSVCHPFRDDNDPILPVAITTGSLLTLFVILVFVAWTRGMLQNRAAVRYAPREAPLCVIVSTVEDGGHLWHQAPDEMSVAIQILKEVVANVVAKHHGYEVKSVGDSTMIVTKECTTAVQLAVDLQLELNRASWPTDFQGSRPEWNGLRVAMVVHMCRDVEVLYDSRNNSYGYFGEDVNIAFDLSDKARGGQILVPERTWQKCQEHTEFLPLIAQRTQSTRWAKEVPLSENTDATTALYSVVPLELRERDFIPKDDLEVSVSTASESEGSDIAPSHLVLGRPEVKTVLDAMFRQLPVDHRKKIIRLLSEVFDCNSSYPTQRRVTNAVAGELAQRLQMRAMNAEVPAHVPAVPDASDRQFSEQYHTPEDTSFSPMMVI